MKTVNVATRRVTLDELLQLAAKDKVRIVAANGRTFILEQAGHFEKEVKLFGKS